MKLTGDRYRFAQNMIGIGGVVFLISGRINVGLALVCLVVIMLLMDIRAAILAKQDTSESLGISDELR
jgi:hypothetical protein